MAPFLLHFNLQKHHSYFDFSSLTIVDLFYFLPLFLNGKYIHCAFLVFSKSWKMQLLPFHMNFNICKYPRYLFCSSHFNFENHHSYFALNFVTTVEHFYCLFRGVSTLNTYTVPSLFADRAQYYYLSLGTLTSKNVCCSFFVVFFPPNMLFLSFCSILSWRCMNRTYLFPI